MSPEVTGLFGSRTGASPPKPERRLDADVRGLGPQRADRAVLAAEYGERIVGKLAHGVEVSDLVDHLVAQAFRRARGTRRRKFGQVQSECG